MILLLFIMLISNVMYSQESAVNGVASDKEYLSLLNAVHEQDSIKVEKILNTTTHVFTSFEQKLLLRISKSFHEVAIENNKQNEQCGNGKIIFGLGLLTYSGLYITANFLAWKQLDTLSNDCQYEFLQKNPYEYSLAGDFNSFIIPSFTLLGLSVKCISNGLYSSCSNELYNANKIYTLIKNIKKGNETV